ncbi:hypothetical protein KTAU_32100 [Thermogemmatispora aurantia]|jgi:hypothetical protein|uniref:Uncharacterized protein n=1 Tax=Thermogemmatispora aurantia TaxID=2045279 RepID=A0A5J4K7G7_9CHLR|nr:hypothetical protein [Thermogemmatispora aurantia]GER84574.1 hypothetical protein KTAU_32100 [Thermogemmatispora aurantia]
MDKPSNQSGPSPLEPATAQETEKEEIAFVPLPGSGQTWPRAAALRSGRRLSGLAALLALFLTALLLCYLFPVGEIAQQLARFFTTEQPASINSASYYLSVDVPWTQITVDGQPLQQKPILAFTSPLQLLRGTHLISWQADPFREQSCTISVPPSLGDSCPTSTTQYPGGRQIQVLWLRDRLSDLSPAQQQALLAALRAAWQPAAWSTTIEPGERYIDLSQSGYIGVARPGQSLQATLQLQLMLDLSGRRASYLACQTGTPDGESGDCPIREENCLQLCALPPWQWQPSSSAGAPSSLNGWHLVALTTLSWDIVRRDGPPIALHQPLGLYSFAPEAIPLAFNITWTGSRWQAQLLTGPALSSALFIDGQQVTLDPACVDAQHGFAEFDQQAVGEVKQVHFFSSSNPAEGCLMTFKVGGQTAAFLERCGLLLAVNPPAHRLQPYWPVANVVEQALAAHLSHLAGWSWWLPLPGSPFGPQ